MYINATKKIDIKTFLLGGREHPAKRRSGQTLVVVHAGVNHREGASAVSFCSTWQTIDMSE
ncbi:hypothetical protein [Ectobacillus panaciterrae]|uniref:hypothetical protein n=1 Tax=Ectobacillus panaciterrae TaxID=363872 RepID=UPI000407835B|nr:hypothetical protein [Ectobacillus panaciterrae]